MAADAVSGILFDSNLEFPPPAILEKMVLSLFFSTTQLQRINILKGAENFTFSCLSKPVRQHQARVSIQSPNAPFPGHRYCSAETRYRPILKRLYTATCTSKNCLPPIFSKTSSMKKYRLNADNYVSSVRRILGRTCCTTGEYIRNWR